MISTFCTLTSDRADLTLVARQNWSSVYWSVAACVLTTSVMVEACISCDVIVAFVLSLCWIEFSESLWKWSGVNIYAVLDQTSSLWLCVTWSLLENVKCGLHWVYTWEPLCFAWRHLPCVVVFVTWWSGHDGIEVWSWQLVNCLQCFNTAVWVLWPVKTVPEMTIMCRVGPHFHIYDI